MGIGSESQTPQRMVWSGGINWKFVRNGIGCASGRFSFEISNGARSLEPTCCFRVDFFTCRFVLNATFSVTFRNLYFF